MSSERESGFLRFTGVDQTAGKLQITRMDQIPDPPAPPVFTRDQLEFMLEQFRREDGEETVAYSRRLLDTFVSSVTLFEDRAVVRFNLLTPGTDCPESVTVTMEENKNPAESGGCSLDSAGSTALRLVEAMGVEPMSEKSSVQGLRVQAIYNIPAASRRSSG